MCMFVVQMLQFISSTGSSIQVAAQWHMSLQLENISPEMKDYQN